MSSHREAPQISKDPVADSTDVYAFVSPDAPETVTLIANYIPLQGPDGGPNVAGRARETRAQDRHPPIGACRPAAANRSGPCSSWGCSDSRLVADRGNACSNHPVPNAIYTQACSSS